MKCIFVRILDILVKKTTYKTNILSICVFDTEKHSNYDKKQ